MKKIIISCQWFGWGPISKAISIINQIKIKDTNIKIIFIGLHNLKDFVNSNKGNIDKVIYIKDYQDIKDYINKINPNYVISIMEPYLIYYSYKKGIKSYFIDSLNFFWDWNKLNVNNINIDDIKNIDSHHKQLLGYKLASKVFIQDLPGMNEQYNFDKIIKSGYIIDSSLRRTNKKKKVIVSFCGLLSPVIDINKSLIYIKFCIEILYISFKELIFYGYKIYIVGNPKILSKLNIDLDNVYINFYSKSEYLKLLQESYFIIGPSSLTSILESLGCNTPYIILPEQHDGHFPNFNVLNNGENVFKGKMLSNYNSNLVNVKENSITSIYETINSLLDNNKLVEEFSSYYLKEIKKMFVKYNYKNCILRQKKKLDFDNKKNGVEYIINNILNYENK